MSCEISEALKALADEYEHATTQKERDRLWQAIVRVSYKQERDREGAHRRDTDIGRFEASMLSLDDPSMRRTENEDSPAWESDGGKGADALRSSIKDDSAYGANDSDTELAKIARKRLGKKSKRILQVFDLLVATRRSGGGGNPDSEDVSPKEAVIRGLMRRNRMSRKVAQTVFLREMKKLEKIFLANKNGGLVNSFDR